MTVTRGREAGSRRGWTTVSLAVAILVIAGGIVPSAVQAAQQTIDLGAASSFSALGGTSVTNTGASVLDSSVGASPGTVITGFPPGFTSGQLHAGDADALAAHADLQAAYDDAVSRIPTGQISGDLAGQTITPGTYNSAAALSLSAVLTLDAQNDPTAVFIFQVDAALATAAGSSVVLKNGAQASNVFWQVTGAISLGASCAFTGTALGLQAITVGASATVVGRVLGINGALTLSSNRINLQGIVELGTALDYSALAATFISNTGKSTLAGNVGVSPGNQITGFPPGVVVGETHLADSAASQAQIDLHTAYSDAESRTPSGVLPPNLNGVVLTPGTYRSSGAVTLGSIISLDARSNPNAIFVLQVKGSFTTAASSQIRLMNQANPNRVFWQVAGTTAIGLASEFAGVLLCSDSITVNTNTNFIGRAFSLSGSVTFKSVGFQTLTPVALGAMANYSALGGTSVDNTGPTVVNLDVGVSPGTTITGFPPGISATGQLHRGDADAAQAQSDAQAAYSDAVGRVPTSSIAGDLAGKTLRSGVFSSAAAISLSTTLVLDGQNDPNSVFIFQIGAAFATSASSTIQLVNGATLPRVFWQIAGATTLGAGSTFVGTLVSPAAITAGSNSTVTGRLISLSGAVSVSSASMPTPTPGSLSSTVSGAILDAVELNGTTTQYATGSSGQWSISDARGTGAAWAMTISATDLISAAGTVDTVERRLPVGNLTIDPGTILPASGADPTSTLTTSVLTLGPEGQILISSEGPNRGQYAFTPLFSLAVPPGAFRSNFAGQLGNSAVNSYVTTVTITIS